MVLLEAWAYRLGQACSREYLTWLSSTLIWFLILCSSVRVCSSLDGLCCMELLIVNNKSNKRLRITIQPTTHIISVLIAWQNCEISLNWGSWRMLAFLCCFCCRNQPTNSQSIILSSGTLFRHLLQSNSLYLDLYSMKSFSARFKAANTGYPIILIVPNLPLTVAYITSFWDILARLHTQSPTLSEHTSVIIILSAGSSFQTLYSKTTIFPARSATTTALSMRQRSLISTWPTYLAMGSMPSLQVQKAANLQESVMAKIQWVGSISSEQPWKSVLNSLTSLISKVSLIQYIVVYFQPLHSTRLLPALSDLMLLMYLLSLRMRLMVGLAQSVCGWMMVRMFLESQSMPQNSMPYSILSMPMTSVQKLLMILLHILVLALQISICLLTATQMQLFSVQTTGIYLENEVIECFRYVEDLLMAFSFEVIYYQLTVFTMLQLSSDKFSAIMIQWV